MYKIIGGDQKEYGPVTAEELHHWIAEGRLNSQSLVLAEGSTEWKALSTFPEFSEALRLQAGQAAAMTGSPPLLDTGAWTAQILARQPEVRVGECLSQSWNLLTANFGLLFAATFLVWMLELVGQFIPFIGPITIWLLDGVLYGGLCLVFLRRLRGQPASVGDALSGFSIAFGQLVLAGALTSMLAKVATLCCLVLPGLYLVIAWLFSVPLIADRRLEFWSAMELSRKVVTRVWFEVFGLFLFLFVPALLAYVFVQIKLGLAIFPMMQQMMGSTPPDFQRLVPAMLQIVKSNMLFLLLTKVVLLFNLPFALGALMYAYENLFGTRTAPPA